MYSPVKTLWEVFTAPFQIKTLWKTNKKKAVGVGTLIAVKTAGALVLWYNPWILIAFGLRYFLPVVGSTMTRIIVSGIKFVLV